MLARLFILWTRARDSLWFIPGVLTILAAILAFVVTEADLSSEPLEHLWMFQGGVEGARGVLGAIAGGLITVTGVVFSVTIVALQLASSQFTPRLLRDFTADRGNQVVLGVFIATFTYTLLVLRTVRSEIDGEDAFVPRIGVTIAVALVLVSIGFLIYFINHSARSIQASVILDRVAQRTIADVRRLFPEHIGHADSADRPDPRRPDNPGVAIRATGSGYLEAVDESSIFRVGEKHDIVIGMEPHIGDFIFEGQVLARVWPAVNGDDDEAETIRNAFVLGPQRTPEQDVEFGIIEISDIAVKALSPGINDPTTALHCIDRLGQILLEFGARDAPAAERTKGGKVHYIGRYTDLERAAGLAFDQIRHFGASNPVVADRLLATIAKLMELLPASRRPTLLAHGKAVVEDARSGVTIPSDLRAIEETWERLFHQPL